MKTIVDRARDLASQSVVYTFDPHPRKVVQPDHPPRMLTTLDQKLEKLAELGLNRDPSVILDAGKFQVPQTQEFETAMNQEYEQIKAGF